MPQGSWRVSPGLWLLMLSELAAQPARSCSRCRRFPPIALKWAAALLKHCDEPQHGIDLLGKDHFLLGKLLVTLGKCELLPGQCWRRGEH